ncbi:MAG TPA: peptidoglycan editing factor PgeF [Ruminococcus sp.]|nr:peptidoglycan editing factor PgeF [Ruminococcus sp.]
MNFQSKTMTLNNIDTVPYLTYNSLSEINFINHAFSTRLGGVSEGEFTSMNMAFNRGDNPESVTENYKRICKSAGFDFNSLTASAQDHNTFVRAVTSENKGVGIYKPRDLHSVDALVTNEKGVTLVTYYADCTPLFFVDTKKKAIGLAHAGWRGTVGRIGEKVVNKMTELYSTNPADIVAAIGPAISVCCYEVDKPCADNFYALADLDSSRFVFPKENGKYMIDLLETNRQILVAAGVENENITLSDICTNCNSDLLWSHRATKGKRGTMSAFMCIK